MSGPQIERLPVADLIPYARNARTHSDQQIQSRDDAARVLHSLVKFGHLAAFALLLDEVGLEEGQLVEDHHV